MTIKKMQFTKKVKQFILDKMAEGNDIAMICEKYPNEVPKRDSIYRKAVQDKDFAEEVNGAYTVLLMHRLDELHKISGQTATEAYPHVEDWRQAEAALKRRIDEAKFVLGKMAPILSKRFDKASKLEVTGLENQPQIAVVNYYKTTAGELKTLSTQKPSKLAVKQGLKDADEGNTKRLEDMPQQVIDSIEEARKEIPIPVEPGEYDTHFVPHDPKDHDD